MFSHYSNSLTFETQSLQVPISLCQSVEPKLLEIQCDVSTVFCFSPLGLIIFQTLGLM